MRSARSLQKKHRRVVRKDSPEGKLSFHISDEVLAGMKEIYRQRLEEVEKMNLPFWNQTSTSTEYTHFRQTTQTNSQNIPMNFQSPLMIEYPQMNQNHPSTSQQPLHNMLTMNSPLVLQQMMSNPNFTVTIREREYNFSSRFQSEIAAIRAPVSSDVSLQFLQPSRAIAPPELKRKVGRPAKSHTETKKSCKEHKPVDDPKNGKNDPTVNKKGRDEARRKAIFDDDSSSEDDNNKKKTVQRGKIGQMPEAKTKEVVKAKLGKVQQDSIQFNPFDDE